MKTRIRIIVQGGCVVGVYADARSAERKAVDVAVLDRDDCGDCERSDRQREQRIDAQIEDGRLVPIW